MSPLARRRRRRRPSRRPRGSRRHHRGRDLSERLGLSVPPDVRLSSHRLFNGHLRVCRNGRLSRRRRQNARLRGCHNDLRHDCLNGRRHHLHLTSASSGGGARHLTQRLFHVRQRVSASGRRRRTRLMVTVLAALGGRRRCCLQSARDLRGLRDLHLKNFLLHSNKSLTRMLRATRSSALLGGSTILRAALAIRRTLGQVLGEVRLEHFRHGWAKAYLSFLRVDDFRYHTKNNNECNRNQPTKKIFDPGNIQRAIPEIRGKMKSGGWWWLEGGREGGGDPRDWVVLGM